MRKLFICAASLALFGCVTVTPREATQTTLQTSKKPAAAIKSLTQALVASGYLIKSVSADAGLIVTEPKGFNVERGVLNVAWPARTTVQLLMGDNAVTLTMTHECGHGDLRFGTASWQHCNTQDSEADQAIATREAEVISLVKKAL